LKILRRGLEEFVKTLLAPALDQSNTINDSPVGLLYPTGLLAGSQENAQIYFCPPELSLAGRLHANTACQPEKDLYFDTGYV
jgi:hypothetical protein